MGVDTEFVVMIGLKKDYDFVKSYNSKNDFEYRDSVECGYINKYDNVVFRDYLPPEYRVYSDDMSCLYSCIGKVLDTSEYLDEIVSISLSIADLQKQIDEVYTELLNLGIKCDKEDIKFYSFVHFS